MEGKPHSHQIGVGRADPYYERGDWSLVYGDTKIRLAEADDDIYQWPVNVLRERIQAAAQEAIRLHDEGSKKAAEEARIRYEKIQNLQQIVQELQPVALDRWATDDPRPSRSTPKTYPGLWNHTTRTAS